MKRANAYMMITCKDQVHGLIVTSLKHNIYALVKLAIPLICTGLLQSSVYFFVTLFLGHLLGENDVGTAKYVGYLGTCLSAFFMFLMALMYWIFPIQLIAIDFDVYAPENKELLHFAIQFLAVCAVFQLFEAVRIAFFGALRAIKDTRFTLYVSIISFWGIALPIGYVLAVYLDFKGVGLWWGMSLSAAINAVLLYWRFEYKMNNYQVQEINHIDSPRIH